LLNNLLTNTLYNRWKLWSSQWAISRSLAPVRMWLSAHRRIYRWTEWTSATIHWQVSK